MSTQCAKRNRRGRREQETARKCHRPQDDNPVFNYTCGRVYRDAQPGPAVLDVGEPLTMAAETWDGVPRLDWQREHQASCEQFVICLSGFTECILAEE